MKGVVTIIPRQSSPALLRAQAVLAEQARGAAGLISPAATTRAMLKALAYEDGADEDAAIAAGRAIRVDPVVAMDCVEAWLGAVLGEII